MILITAAAENPLKNQYSGGIWYSLQAWYSDKRENPPKPPDLSHKKLIAEEILFGPFMLPEMEVMPRQ